MSEHHRGAWGTREEAVWWPGAITSTDQQTLQQHHQHLINQHHQQQLAQQQAAQIQQQQQHQAAVQQQQQSQQQAHNESRGPQSTASVVPTQQLFSYKMASSFQNPATTISGTTVVTSNSPVGAYDYRLMGGMVARPGDPQSMSGNPGTQWWYPGGQNIDNALQQHQNQQHQQNLHNVHTPPPSNQHIQQNNQQAHQNQNNQQIQIHTQNAKMPRGGKVDAKPRGRMTAYAFFVQTCREEHKKKHPEETVIFAEFSRKCAERWKTMLDKEKKRFHEMAEKDKKRYDLEMQNYVPPKGTVVGRGKKRKQIKDPNAPKRSLSAFFWFCNDERMKVKALNPEYGVGDIAKELGRKWSDADPEVKSKYEAMAEKDKARYEREMTEYKKKSKGIQQVPVPPPVHDDDDDDDDDGDDDENA
ncbi:high mobility group protein DSP1 [Lutzomyia longipalpis]|uniref:Putative hmg box-containing protein n=1 Tax=Lutzomyia longipalpis TaxID=7200 RepID=A0A7G3AM19_LUTLO|nr:high mobility group protein DSP1 [Lutzomyia longipalpis]XP_055684693.1 high mobility group protein DSP1 [Lutzomyia longipalpis]XP_055684694.1 high mobility group protein DSP1 [Lutzomyia longipalpis]XP_055684695.1 high mobility group protein DSP1 [Lutzomyia longipalpis]XP_055684697.1 high mobility group protein DSP1 [Lutzomyia longipalpis]XP_055684698.1 high mobility group protein DSP1 [Lutzomyia longipalpis]XP_055684699.1 high mobility group protein DSP1 [Lutzomyia longipalpis]